METRGNNILYLDRVQMGDMLFLQAVAAQYKRRTSLRAILIVHGVGEPAERLLESKGFVPVRDGDILRVGTLVERALVERATREAGRRIAAVLTDATISAVSVCGSDRRMLTRRGDRPVVAARVGWLMELVDRGVVPVLALLAHDDVASTSMEPDPAAAIVALVDALGRDASSIKAVAADARPGSASERIRERSVLARVASAGIDVRLGELTSLGTDAGASWSPFRE